MSSLPFDIPGLKKSLIVLEHALYDLDQSLERVKTSIESLNNINKDLKDDAIEKLSLKVDPEFLEQLVGDLSDKISVCICPIRFNISVSSVKVSHKESSD